MAFEFTETFDLVIPNVEQQLNDFSESEFRTSHGLIVELAAIHAGMTSNFNRYSAGDLQEAVNSWLEPYPKPIIMNHDIKSEPVGRVMGAKMDKEADGTPFIRLQAAITDPEAIKKVSDGRYLTGSVGGKANEALCSICHTDWAKPVEGRKLPCRHQRGKVYNGEIAVLDMKNPEFKEYSFVNVPADNLSSIRKMGESTEGDWIKPARFFVLDMVSEGVVEYTESENRNVLDGLKKKDASPLYLGLKGAFLSAQVIHESELEENITEDGVNPSIKSTNTGNTIITDEEISMANEATEPQEDDILAVSEGLSADLSAVAEPVEEETPASDEVEENEETPEAPAEESEETEEVAEVTEPEEGERPNGQEKPHDKDVDPDTSAGAPKSRESEEEVEAEVEPAEAAPEEEAEVAAEEQADETELSANESAEPRVEELKAQVATLTEENTRLRKALHRTLVERVVDAKIGVGLVEADARAAAIEEHTDRTASSLADSLRDLAAMPRSVETSRNATEGLEMTQESEVVGNEKNVATMGDEAISESETKDPMLVAEGFFTDVLMGRKKA